jgi:hypothetical protein
MSVTQSWFGSARAKSRSTRSFAIRSGRGGFQRDRPVTPWIPAWAMSISTGLCPTVIPRPRVSSACTRRAPYVPFDAWWTSRIWSVSQAWRIARADGARVRSPGAAGERGLLGVVGS